MLDKLNKRRRKLLWKLLKNTRINRDLFLYFVNLAKSLGKDRNKSLTIVHPRNVMIELGNVCNLHCTMCPREHDFGKKMAVGFMAVEKAKQIIDQMYPYLDSCGLTGLGETFLYPHILEIAQYIKTKKKSIIITVSTNGHFRGFREAIEPVLPYIDNIQFSIDGIGKTYDKIRAGASFQEVAKNIRFVMEKGKDTTCMLNCVVSPENYFQMADVVDFAHDLGVMYVNFNCVSIAAQPTVGRSFYEFFKSQEYLSAVKTMRRKTSEWKNMEITGPYFPENPSFKDCGYPWEYPYITWDGYYVPCCGKPFPKLLHFGNVFEADVMSVLNSEEAQKFRRLWQKNIAPSFCHNCQLTDN